jgi:hypothetical protein
MGMRMERKAARCSASPMGETSAPDHLDIHSNGHEDGAKGGQMFSVSHGRSSSWTTQTYLAIGMRIERKAARYSASPMGGSSPPDQAMFTLFPRPCNHKI